MKFLISLSCLICMPWIQASSTSNTRFESTRNILPHSDGHNTSETSLTTNTDITENDFLNKTCDEVLDEPNQVILHTTIRLRTPNSIKVIKEKINVENDTESDHTVQDKLEMTGTLESSSSDKSVLQVRKRIPTPKPGEVLIDTTSTVSPVEVQEGNTEVTSTLQEPSVPQVNNRLEELIIQGEYDNIFELDKEMSDEEFMKQLCPVIETPAQYTEIVDHLKDRKMVASFYVHGNIGVVKRAIVESRVYGGYVHYVDGGDLETALPLALEKDRHDRVIELLDVRKGITAVMEGGPRSFTRFVYEFLYHLAPWEDGMTLRRFLIFRGEELRTKYPGILDTLCQELIYHLSDKLDLPKAEGLLIDLIGQPSLLTPVVFARGFLDYGTDKIRSNFTKYGWRETIQEGLKSEYEEGGKELWRVMQAERPDQFRGEFPVTEEARAAVCMHFPTKQQKEDVWIKKNGEWIKENALILYNKLKPQDILYLLPDVLWTIISEYAVYIK